MYIRRHSRKKNGKDHFYWSLVESYRTAKGPRNRIVAYLGELKDSERKGWVNFCKAIDGKSLTNNTLSLFPKPDKDTEIIPDKVEVKIDGIDVEGSFDFGDIWLALILWRSLELDKLFGGLLTESNEDILWNNFFAILSFARFCEPSSESHICDNWYPHTSLPILFGIQPESVYPNRLYRALDKLLPFKRDIEKHLKSRLGVLFDIKYDILLYDITSTYFEGEAKSNNQAKRGYSRDKRSDCKQVCIGLVVTPEGIPLGYEVFDGNRSDVTTVEDIVDAMESKYGQANRIWVMDRGMVSEDNLKYIRDRDGQYIVGANRHEMKNYEKALTGKDWEDVYEDLEVKKCPSPDDNETFILCRSKARAKKEKAMHERFSKKIEDALNKLSNRLSRAKKKPDRDQVNRQIGRILQKNSHSAGRYKVTIKDDPKRKNHLQVYWEINTSWEEWMKLRDGSYILRTNINNLSGEELWKMYNQLTDVEASFRCIKSDIGIRPVYHHKEDRVNAHILVAFLGYVLFKTLDMWCVRSGLGHSARTVISELKRLKCTEVKLPTKQNHTLFLNCVTCPDKHQQALLDRLKLEIPRRLGKPKWKENIKM